MTQEQEVKQEKQGYAADMKAEMNIDINLTVHLDDGTTKDLHLVAHNFKFEKEQQA